MSTTLRFDVGADAAAVVARLGGHTLGDVAVRRNVRWGGHAGTDWHCVTVSLRLPRDLAAAWALRRVAFLAADEAAGRAASAARTLAVKLTAALGLPAEPVAGPEAALVRALANAPGDRATWAAYADWLTARPDPLARARGALIAATLAKAPGRSRYGMPVLAGDAHKTAPGTDGVALTLGGAYPAWQLRPEPAPGATR